jgi:uncharacterized protein YbjT (DUF2867 family)
VERDTIAGRLREEAFMLVLIVGATGVLGRETMHRLREAGHRVRGMTRDPARFHAIAASGAEPVCGDLTDASSLAKALAGADGVFAAAHAALGRGRNRSENVDDAGHRALVAGARKAGVSRFVYTSAFGADPDHPVDFFRTKWAIEQFIASSGVDHVVLRPTAFMEWHAHAFIGERVLERGSAVILGKGTRPRNFVAAADVASVAVEALTHRSPAHQMLAVAGPGNFTNEQVARLYARCAGAPERIRHVPRGIVAAARLLVRPLHPGLSRALLLSTMDDGRFPETFDARTCMLPHVVGPTTLEAFVQARVREYGPR